LLTLAIKEKEHAMPDVSFSCPNCRQHLDAPPEMAGEVVSCPSCQKNIRVPEQVQRVPVTPKQTRPPQPPVVAEVKTNVKQGALIGGCVCFLLGILFMCMTIWSVIIYAPLFFAAFVLSIVAMAQKRIAGGVLLLLGTLIIPPLGFVAVPAFKNAKAAAESHAKQAQNLRVSIDQATVETTNNIDVSQAILPKPSHEVLAPQPESPKPMVPELKLGESVVIDEIKITPLHARFGYIERKSRFGEGTTRSDEQYLIIDVMLENTSEGKIVYLQDIWEKTKISDNFDNVEGTKFSGDLMMDSIVGFVHSAKMKPGENLKDMIIFDLPVDAAKQFKIESDPGFWKSIGENRVRQLSDSSFLLKFKREDIKPD